MSTSVLSDKEYVYTIASSLISRKLKKRIIFYDSFVIVILMLVKIIYVNCSVISANSFKKVK